MDSESGKIGVVCVGAAHLDRTARIRGPVRLASSNPVSQRTHVGGVACNVARNLARLGNAVTAISIVGRDAEGDLVTEALAGAGVDVGGLVRTDLQTGSYVAVLDEAGELVIGLANLDIYDRVTIEVIARHDETLRQAAAVLMDANLPAQTLSGIVEAAPPDCRLFAATVSPAKAPRLVPLLPRITGVFANCREAAVLVGLPPETPEDPLRLASRLQNLGPTAAFVTSGPQGAAVCAEDFEGQHQPPAPQPLRDVNGAGDGFTAGVIDALLRGRGSEDALRQGLALASLACESGEPASPAVTRDAVIARMTSSPEKDT